ncbi:unnamed protein product [Ixodes hexagonus]
MDTLPLRRDSRRRRSARRQAEPPEAEPGLAPELPLKVILVGDSRCGKTALATRFVTDAFTEVYTPTGFDRYSTSYEVAGQRVHYSVWDTSGSPAYDTVRPLSYQDASVVLLCFHVGSPESLQNVLHKWFPEVRKHCPAAALVLVGCQSDARQIQRQPHGADRCVSAEEAVATARQLGVTAYVETSARCAPRSVRDAWKAAAQAALGETAAPEGSRDTSPMRHRTCSIM